MKCSHQCILEEKRLPQGLSPLTRRWVATSATDAEPSGLQKWVCLNNWKAVAKSCLTQLSGLKADCLSLTLFYLEDPRILGADNLSDYLYHLESKQIYSFIIPTPYSFFCVCNSSPEIRHWSLDLITLQQKWPEILTGSTKHENGLKYISSSFLIFRNTRFATCF